MRFSFSGCSITAGEGLELEKDDPLLYTNIVSERYSASTSNIAEKGNSNQNIFLSALSEILFNTPDVMFVQWSGLNRMWLYPTPTSKLFLPLQVTDGYRFNTISYTKKELQYLSTHWHILYHDYKHTVDLISYCNMLAETAKNRTKIVYVNGILPWTNDLDSEYQALTDYTKELVDMHRTSINESNSNLQNLRKSFSSLDKALWVNQFESFHSLLIDKGLDNLHPGSKSHALYADMIISYLEERI